MTTISNLDSIVSQVLDIAISAGKEIMRFYKSDYKIEIKSNNSPVTEADAAANQLILESLNDLQPDIPFVSEECQIASYEQRTNWQHYWLIDPLDGTKSFVRADDQFTVNIALIDRDHPIFGVVYSPVEEHTYWGIAGVGAFLQKGTTGPIESIHTRRPQRDTVTIIAPAKRGHRRVQDFIDNLGSAAIRCHLTHSSSSIKFCRVAEGVADIFPSFGATSEWDTAAAQCVVECAGGSVRDFEGNTLIYNKPDPSLINSPFLVSGANDFDWLQYIPEI